MKTKEFDSVQFVESVQEEIYDVIKAMTTEEELEFWRRETEKLRQIQQEARRRKDAQRVAS